MGHRASKHTSDSRSPSPDDRLHKLIRSQSPRRSTRLAKIKVKIEERTEALVSLGLVARTKRKNHNFSTTPVGRRRFNDIFILMPLRFSQEILLERALLVLTRISRTTIAMRGLLCPRRRLMSLRATRPSTRTTRAAPRWRIQLSRSSHRLVRICSSTCRLKYRAWEGSALQRGQGTTKRVEIFNVKSFLIPFKKNLP